MTRYKPSKLTLLARYAEDIASFILLLVILCAGLVIIEHIARVPVFPV